MEPQAIVFVLCLLGPAAVSLLPLDCNDIYKENSSAPSGVYHIYPVDDHTAVKVYCDMDTDRGRWTVFQRRMDGTVSFYRPWDQYKGGFGSADGEYWLGLENLYYLTFKRSELRVDMEDFTGDTAYAHYSSFYIDSEAHGYMLHVAQFKGGAAGDALYYNNEQKFSTQDKDHDSHSSIHCARDRLGGYWYRDCSVSNPNGIYMWVTDDITDKLHIQWEPWKGYYYPLKSISMKIRALSPREDQDENTDV